MTRRPTSTPADVAPLHEALHRRLAPDAAAWLGTALREAAVPADGARLPAWERHFASAGRRCRAAGGSPPPLHDRFEPAEAARVLILHAARADAPALSRVYTRGSAAERRAVLLSLPYLPHLGHDAVPLVEDALRTHDTRLIAAAVGPYAAAHLTAHSWRHAVLKCLFTGVRTTDVAGLAGRARGDGELARMLTDYAAERTAAGRPVPDDLHHVLTLTAAHPKEC